MKDTAEKGGDGQRGGWLSTGTRICQESKHPVFGGKDPRMEPEAPSQ